MKRLFLILLIGIVSFGMIACSKGTNSKEIKVAVSPASPPMLFDQNGQIVGVDMDIFQGYCQSRGCTLKVTTNDWQRML